MVNKEERRRRGVEKEPEVEGGKEKEEEEEDTCLYLEVSCKGTSAECSMSEALV